MSKITRYTSIGCMLLVVAMLSVSAFASGATIDSSAIAGAFSSSISATIEIIMGIVPLAGGLLAVSLGIKKGIQFVNKF